MSTSPFLNVDPAELTAAAVALDLLAARLDTAMAQGRPVIEVDVPARDEVSMTAAASAHDVGVRFGADIAAGARELRRVAAQLRVQATAVESADGQAYAGLVADPHLP